MSKCLRTECSENILTREEEVSQHLRVLHNNLYCSVNIVIKAKFRKLRCVGDVARVGREITH